MLKLCVETDNGPKLASSELWGGQGSTPRKDPGSLRSPRGCRPGYHPHWPVWRLPQGQLGGVMEKDAQPTASRSESFGGGSCRSTHVASLRAFQISPCLILRITLALLRSLGNSPTVLLLVSRAGRCSWGLWLVSATHPQWHPRYQGAETTPFSRTS